MTAGMRPLLRSFFAPARRPRARPNASSATDFIVLKFSLVILRRRPLGLGRGHRFNLFAYSIVLTKSQLTCPSAFEFKQRGHRRIAMDSFDGFAQKRRDGQRRNLYAANSRAKDCISCDQFVNT